VKFPGRLLLLAAAMFLVNLVFAQTSDNKKPLSIEAIYQPGGLIGRLPETVQWSPDGSKLSYILRDDSGEHGQLFYVDVAAGRPAVLVSEQKMTSLAPPLSRITNEREKEARSRYSVAGYHWSPDAKHLLFDANGQLWLYDLSTGIGLQMTSGAEPSGDPKFSPNAEMLAYVRGNDLYVHPLDRNGVERRLTNERDEEVLDGVVDWLYEEELGVRSNYFWSPDSRQILFLQTDERPVPRYPITDFIPQHPVVDPQKYPNAGDPNPEVRLGVVGMNSGPKWLKLPIEKGNFYIPRFGWVRPGLAWVQVMNRAQDRLDLYFVDTGNGRSQLMLSETSDTWVEVMDDFRLLASGDHFLWSSWRDGHTHLYLYRFNGKDPLTEAAQLERQLTHGDFEVTSVASVDESAGTVYLIANAGDDRQRNLFAVQLDGSGFRRISREEGTHTVNFSPGSRYYVDTFSSHNTPQRLSLCRPQDTCNTFFTARTLQQQGYAVDLPQFVDFKAEDGTVLRGSLQMPKNIPAGSKVPLLLNPYGGPGAMTVTDSWNTSDLAFDNLLAGDGIAVLHVDNRGMADRGKKFTAALRHNMGEVELKDQIAAMQQLRASHPEIDGNRVGFWGWSYGGYFTLYALEHSTLFRAGFAVAPVTDWRQYDSTYTERYMGLPKDNPEGYNRSSPQKSAATLHGELMIAHGSGDDNVHMQNTIQMVQELISAGKPYGLLLYPRLTHGIGATEARIHLFKSIRSFFDEKLGGIAPAATGERKHE
jgi:dipeptidyl-peptidase 4